MIPSRNQPVLLHVHMPSSVFYIHVNQHGGFNSLPLSVTSKSENHRNAEQPAWRCHTRCCRASLTSLTEPPLPHTQHHGVHGVFPNAMLKPSYQNGIRLTVPSLFGQTSILPAGLLNTEPPLDATRCLIILHPVATTTPHNVSRNADCRCAVSKGKIFTFSVH